MGGKATAIANLLTTLVGHTGKVKGITFSPDSQILASSSDDLTIRLWRRDGTLLNSLRGHGNAIHGINFSPDGQRLVAASTENTVTEWHLEELYNLDGLLAQSCSWLQGFLQNNPMVSAEERSLCDDEI